MSSVFLNTKSTRTSSKKRGCKHSLTGYINNLDVAPGLEAFKKMGTFYTGEGINILKDAASLPGMSLHLPLRGLVERGAVFYSPCKVAYGMLKEAVIGGLGLVFTHYHEAGVTKQRPHRVKETKVCKQTIGYNVNTLYLSTMSRNMPCGLSLSKSGRCCTYATRVLESWNLVQICRNDIEIPEPLWQRFEEMLPFFFTKRFQTKLYINTDHTSTKKR